jgi:hypothetical protein
MYKRIFRVVVALLAFQTHQVFSQTDDLGDALHKKVEHFLVADPEREDVAKMQGEFADHSKGDVANALIADLDVDRGEAWKNRERDNAVRKVYKALNLPPGFVCDELEKKQSPQRKSQLIGVLRGINTSEVTKALLDQIKDRRPAVDHIGYPPQESLRVCDVAYNTLLFNAVGGTLTGDLQWINYAPGDEHRDAIIQRTLKELKLVGQQ